MSEIIVENENLEDTKEEIDKITSETPAELNLEEKEEVEVEVEVETEADAETETDSLDDLEKWKKFARQHENDKKKLKSDNDELMKKLEDSNTELESLKHSLLIKDVVSELGLNEKQAGFLSGKTKEELIKSGSELLEAFGSNKKTTAFKQGVSENVKVSTAPKTREEAFKALQNKG